MNKKNMNKKNRIILLVVSLVIVFGSLIGAVVLSAGNNSAQGLKTTIGALSLGGIKPQTSCQNYPGPNFCSDKNSEIYANGMDKKGCIIWACRIKKVNHYIVVESNHSDSSSSDITIAKNLKNYLAKELGSKYSFSIKTLDQLSMEDFKNRVTTFIYDQKALVINKETDYGIVLKKFPLTGNPAITEYLGGNNGMLVIPRDSSAITTTDLRKELYQNCKNAGEKWRVMPQTRYNVCCQGLDYISVAALRNEYCVETPEYRMCSDCGNGICEAWENRCNCSSDCK